MTSLRQQAEYEYSTTAFNYEQNPIGSRDWCLYWDGFKAGCDTVKEKAAQICEGVNNYDNPMTANDCADAIRALKPLYKEPETIGEPF